MSAAKTIRRLGFRKWYERELLQSHALVLAVDPLYMGESVSAKCPVSQCAMMVSTVSSFGMGSSYIKYFPTFQEHDRNRFFSFFSPSSNQK